MTVLLWLGALVGCDDAPPPPPPHSRFESVAAVEVTEDAVSAFCDVRPAAAEASTFAWPALDGAGPAEEPGWTWVTLWATWCAPCIAEMPLMAEWQGKLAADGAPVTLRYVSVDADAKVLERWLRTHDDAPATVRVADPEAVTAWLEGLGVPAGGVPIHLWVDPERRVRCARLGGVSSPDYAVVRKLLRTP